VMAVGAKHLPTFPRIVSNGKMLALHHTDHGR